MRIAAVKGCKPTSIAIWLDGDDALIGKFVFQMLNAQYQSRDIWFLYTNFIYPDTGNGGFSD